MADENNSEKILWFVAGVSAGAAIAILFAPASGRETRATIAKKTGQGRDAIAESGRDLLERGRDMMDRARRMADQASEVFERGRKLVDETAAHLQQAANE